MSGLEFPHSLEDGSIGGRVQERKIVIERLQIDLAIDRAGGQQRLDLGSEIQATAAFDAMNAAQPQPRSKRASLDAVLKPPHDRQRGRDRRFPRPVSPI
jgi:hypothetical protein